MGAIINEYDKNRGFGHRKYVLVIDKDFSGYKKSLVKIVDADCNRSLNLELALEYETGQTDVCELPVQQALKLLEQKSLHYYSGVIGRTAIIYEDECGRKSFIFVKK